jgi:N-sulfoglucosamine sulfohydrolase
MYWFRTSKPDEELFDTKSDPHEFNNLAADPALRAKLLELRAKHKEWIGRFGDMGAIPEREMIAKWWSGKDKAPVTSNPEIQKADGKLSLTCPTAGASIGFKSHPNDKVWQVYSKPFGVAKGDSVYIVAHRIGYEPSETIKFRMD